MPDNEHQATYLTELEFGIDKIPQNLKTVEEQFIASAKRINAIMDKEFNFSQSAKEETQEIKYVFNDVFKDVSSKTSKMFPETSFKNLKDAKNELSKILQTTGEISKIELFTSKNQDELKRATVLMKDFDGRQISESFKLVKQNVGEAVDGVQKYNLVWKQVGDRKYTDNIEQRNKQLAKEEQQAIRTAKAQEQKRQSQLSMYAGLFEKIEAKEKAENKSFKNEIERIDALINKQKSFTKTQETKKQPNQALISESKILTEQLNLIRSQFNARKKLTEEEKDLLSQLKKTSGELKTQAITAKIDTPRESFGQQIIDKIRWTSAFRLTQLAEQGLRETIKTLKEVEFSVMEITRVLNDSSLNVQEFTGDIFGLAIEYANTFENASEITKRFAQAGYDASESLLLMKKTMLALNTAELNMEQSTQSLIGIMQQWGIEVEQYGLLIDKINITADNFAVTSQDIVDGLLRSGAAAKNAKFSFDETVGALVAMREASGRTGREVGNALNSLIAYMTRAKSLNVFESMGIKVWADESKTSLVPLLDIWGQLSKRLNETGENGEKLIYDLELLTDMSNLMNEEVALATNTQNEYNQMLEYQNQLENENLTEMQKKSVYEQAGTHRRNYFMALLTNFNKIQEVTNNLQDAEGYSMRENAKYMETLQAKYIQLITSLKELAVQAGDAGFTDMAKMALDTATSFTELIKNTGGLSNSIKLLLGLFVLIKRQSINDDFKKISKSVITLTANMENFSLATLKAKVSTQGLTSVGLAGWLGLALIAYSLVTSAISAHNSQLEKNREQAIKTGQEVENQATNLLKLVSTYENLISISKRSDEQTRQLNEVSEKLNDTFNNRGKTLQGLTADSEKYTEALYAQIQAEMKANAGAVTQTRVALEDEFKQAFKTEDILGIEFTQGFKFLTEFNSELSNTQNILKDILSTYSKDFTSQSEMYTAFVPTDTDTKSLMEYYNELVKAKDEVDAYISTLDKSQAIQERTSEAYTELYNEINSLTEPMQKYIEAKTKEEITLQGISRELYSSNEAYGAYRKNIIEQLQVDEMHNFLIEKTIDEYLNLRYIIPIVTEETQSLNQAQKEIAYSINEAKLQYGELEEQIKNVETSLNELKNAYSTLTSAQNEYNQSGSLSTDTLIKLLQLNPQYLTALEYENGQLKLNKTAIQNLTLAELDELEVAQYRKILNLFATIKNDADAQAILTGATKEASLASAEYYGQLLNVIYAMEKAGTISDGTAKNLFKFAGTIGQMYEDTRKKILSNEIDISLLFGGGAGEQKMKSYYETQVELFERLNGMGQKTTQQVVDFYRTMANSGKISADERIKAEDKLFNAIKKNIQETTKVQINSLNQQKEAIEEKAKDEIEALQEVEKENDRIRQREEYLKTRSEIVTDIQKAQSRSGIEARTAEAEGITKLGELDKEYRQKLEKYELEDTINEINRVKDAQIQAIDEQINSLNKMIEESNLNNLAYYQTFSDNAFDIVAKEFIEPIVNGYVDGWGQANQMVEENIGTSADIMRSIVDERFLRPTSKAMLDLLQLSSKFQFPNSNLSPSDILALGKGAISNESVAKHFISNSNSNQKNMYSYNNAPSFNYVQNNSSSANAYTNEKNKRKAESMFSDMLKNSGYYNLMR